MERTPGTVRCLRAAPRLLEVAGSRGLARRRCAPSSRGWTRRRVRPALRLWCSSRGRGSAWCAERDDHEGRRPEGRQRPVWHGCAVVACWLLGRKEVRPARPARDPRGDARRREWIVTFSSRALGLARCEGVHRTGVTVPWTGRPCPARIAEIAVPLASSCRFDALGLHQSFPRPPSERAGRDRQRGIERLVGCRVLADGE
jgi:hypothetical protein